LRTVSSNMEELRKFPEELVRIVPNRTEEWIEAIQSFLDSEIQDARQIGAEVAGRFIWEDVTADLLEKIRGEI